MRKFKETKKQFDKVREDLELSLVRNAQAPRHRPHEVEEATGALTVTRKCFRHLALDYVLQVSGQRGARVPGAVGVPRAGVCWGGFPAGGCHREAPLAPENLHCQVWGSDMAGKQSPNGAGPAGAAGRWGRGPEDLAEGLRGTWSRNGNAWLCPWGGRDVPTWERTPGLWEEGLGTVQGAEDEQGVSGNHSSWSGFCGKVQAIGYLGPDTLCLLTSPLADQRPAGQEEV